MKLFCPHFSFLPPGRRQRRLNQNRKAVYRKMHPVAYRVWIFLAAAVFCLPLGLFFAQLVGLTRAGAEIFGPLGGTGAIGAMVVGFGLANLVLAFVQDHLGLLVSLASLAAGGLILWLTYLFIP